MAKKSSAASPPAGSSAGRSFTDTKRVKELIDLMTDNGLTEIELVEDKSRILLRRGSAGAVASPVVHAAPVHVHAPRPDSLGPTSPVESEDLVAIKAPMVGTFYAAASPDASPYVSVGATVDDKTVVCMIESMKHFNEIPAETRGTITKVLVSNGQVVEFNQPLFLVKPD